MAEGMPTLPRGNKGVLHIEFNQNADFPISQFFFSKCRTPVTRIHFIPSIAVRREWLQQGLYPESHRTGSPTGSQPPTNFCLPVKEAYTNWGNLENVLRLYFKCQKMYTSEKRKEAYQITSLRIHRLFNRTSNIRSCRAATRFSEFPYGFAVQLWRNIFLTWFEAHVTFVFRFVKKKFENTNRFTVITLLVVCEPCVVLLMDIIHSIQLYKCSIYACTRFLCLLTFFQAYPQWEVKWKECRVSVMWPHEH